MRYRCTDPRCGVTCNKANENQGCVVCRAWCEKIDDLGPRLGSTDIQLIRSDPDRERIQFIRRAAIALTGGVQEMGPERAWQWAEALWNAKPEGL